MGFENGSQFVCLHSSREPDRPRGQKGAHVIQIGCVAGQGMSTWLQACADLNAVPADAHVFQPLDRCGGAHHQRGKFAKKSTCDLWQPAVKPASETGRLAID